MRYVGLRGFIDLVRERGDLVEVGGADPDLEMGALTVLAAGKGREHPAVLFDDVKGHRRGFRVLGNGLTSPSRSKLAFGLDPDEELKDPVRFIAERLAAFKPVAPREVGDGPVMENVQRASSVDLGLFPAPKWHPLDGGRYIGTGTLVVLRDPDTARVNVGTYRFQLHDRKTLGVAINPGHHGAIIRDKYWERGLACPVVLTLGHDPCLATAANMGVPWGECEYDYAGWLMGRPVDAIPGPLTGLPIPSDAEIAIEGEIPPETVEARVEGPFGEFGGYYSAEASPQPVVRVGAVYYRNDPIALGTPTYKGIRHNGVLPIPDAVLLLALQKMGFDVRGVGRAGPFVAVSLKVRYAGQALRAADVVMAGFGMRPPKYVVIVDEDIDPSNPEDVFWAIQSRADPESSVQFMRGRWGAPTDPRIPPSKKATGDITTTCLVFDATRPWAWRGSFPKASDFPPEVISEYRSRWSGQLAGT